MDAEIRFGSKSIDEITQWHPETLGDWLNNRWRVGDLLIDPFLDWNDRRGEDRRFFDGQVRFEIVPASKGKRDKIALATFKKEHRAEQITAPVVTLGACSRDR
jgi:hypothetical protein